MSRSRSTIRTATTSSHQEWLSARVIFIRKQVHEVCTGECYCCCDTILVWFFMFSSTPFALQYTHMIMGTACMGK